MDRRGFLKAVSAGAAGLALSGRQAGSQPSDNRQTTAGFNEENSAKKNITGANILLIVADQHRRDCLGCYGNEIVRTPVLDNLAASGVCFNNAFTPTAVCCPARASIQTGLLAHRHGIIRNSEWANPPYEAAATAEFFARNLADSGYKCAHIGKWHVASKKPCEYGYENEVFYPGYGYPSGHPHYEAYLKNLGLNGFNLLEEKKDPSGQRSYYGLQEGVAEASTPAYLRHQTVDAIKRFTAAGRPFFISCNFWGPHSPYYIPQPYYNMYRDAPIKAWPNFDCSLSDKPEIIRRYGKYWRTGWITRKNLRELISKYYGYISLIDHEIGNIINALKACGQFENTLIIYTADHGGTEGAYRMWDKGFGMYDCIWRIPMIISGTSVAPAVSDAFVSLVDMANTVLETAGCAHLNDSDGSSLVPIIKGKQAAVRDDYIVCQGYGHQIPFWQRMVRTSDEKYIYNPADRDEFYDLTADPWERVNIIDKIGRKKLAQMKAMLLDVIERTKDPVQKWAQFTV